MKYAPLKIFKLEEGEYLEISYEEYQILLLSVPRRFFWMFGAMLMEVPEKDYIQMNREKSRQQYVNRLGVKNGLFSYDSIGMNDFEQMLVFEEAVPDVFEVVEKRILVNRLRQVMETLEEQEKELIQSLYFENLSEREYGTKLGISQAAVNKRKKAVLGKLRKML